MIIYDEKESIAFLFEPKQDGVAVGMSTYTAGQLLDGTTGSLKVRCTVKDSAENTVVDDEGITLDQYMFRGTDENTAVYTCVQGINLASGITYAKYTVSLWYESPSIRINDVIEFAVQRLGGANDPPNN